MLNEKKIPERTCVICKKHLPKENFFRIVKTKENLFLLDTSGKTDGRGIYICKNAMCVTKAKKTRVLSKIFKMETQVSIYEELELKLNDKN